MDRRYTYNECPECNDLWCAGCEEETDDQEFIEHMDMLQDIAEFSFDA